MDLEFDPELPRLVDAGGQVLRLLLGRMVGLGDVGVVDLGDGVGPRLYHPVDSGADLGLVLHLRRRHPAGADDARPLDLAALDLSLQLQHARIVVAAGLHRRHPGFQELAHVGRRLLPHPLGDAVGPPAADDMAVIVDVAGDQGHAGPVDQLGALRDGLGGTGPDRGDSAVADHQGALLDGVPGPDDDAGVRDHEVLGLRGAGDGKGGGHGEAGGGDRSAHAELPSVAADGPDSLHAV